MTSYALAAACRVPRTRFERLANERAKVSPDTAPEFWLAIQAHYDVETARRMNAEDIEAIQPRVAA